MRISWGYETNEKSIIKEKSEIIKEEEIIELFEEGLEIKLVRNPFCYIRKRHIKGESDSTKDPPKIYIFQYNIEDKEEFYKTILHELAHIIYDTDDEDFCECVAEKSYRYDGLVDFIAGLFGLRIPRRFR